MRRKGPIECGVPESLVKSFRNKVFPKEVQYVGPVMADTFVKNRRKLWGRECQVLRRLFGPYCR